MTVKGQEALDKITKGPELVEPPRTSSLEIPEQTATPEPEPLPPVLEPSAVRRETLAELSELITLQRSRELNLLDLLKRMAEHVAIRNAMGEISKEFCKGCKHGRKQSCPLPETLKEIGLGMYNNVILRESGRDE